jgi:hypothetical protein
MEKRRAKLCLASLAQVPQLLQWLLEEVALDNYAINGSHTVSICCGQRLGCISAVIYSPDIVLGGRHFGYRVQGWVVTVGFGVGWD